MKKNKIGSISFIKLIIVGQILMLSITSSFAQIPPKNSTVSKPFQQIIGIIGNPTNPDCTWSDEQLEAMKKLGVNTLQLSIAWSWKPKNEVLNLEDLDDPQIAANYLSRIEKARKHGFRTLAHFGIPKASKQSNEVPECIMDEKISANYQKRIFDFMKTYGSDDIMIYNYDQLAWLCSEYGNCPRCKGIPLHERLVPFLEGLINAMQKAKPGSRLWWEPWELSEGQIIEVVEHIKTENFGIIMHNSIAEVYFINTTDLAFRNVARLAASRGIPFVGEGFFGSSGEDVETLHHLACPRLVYQELEAMRNTEGLTGIKEYYGFVPSDFSVNEALFSLYQKSSGKKFQEYIEPIAATYGDAKQTMMSAWEMSAWGLETFPFNASWRLKFLIKLPAMQTNPKIPSCNWETPSWRSSRKGYYMMTLEAQIHPWFYEDVGLRASASARKFALAVDLMKKAESITSMKEEVALQKQDYMTLMETYKKFGEIMLSSVK